MMKKLIGILVCGLFCVLPMWGGLYGPQDTTIYLDNRRMEIEKVGDRLKVRVFDLTEEDGYLEREKVFEGHYKDGQSYEKRKYLRSLPIPVPSWDRDFSPHWAGFGLGFANFADGDLNINHVSGVSLRSGKSLEYNLNFLEKAFPFSRYPWAVVTGMGLRWNRYRVSGNVYFKEVNGTTVLLPPVGELRLDASKLNTTSLTIPVLLEWQKRSRGKARYFVSAGVVGVIKTMSSSKIVYRNDKGKKVREKVDGGMNLRPVTMDFLVQAGFKGIGAYAKYSPVTMFENDRGPKLHPVSVGLHLHL